MCVKLGSSAILGVLLHAVKACIAAIRARRVLTERISRSRPGGRSPKGKKTDVTPSGRLLISKSGRRVRRVFRVNIKGVIGRRDLGVRIIDTGLAVSVLKFRPQGREIRFYFPKVEMVISDLSW